MSSINDGEEQVTDLPPLSPYADLDEIRTYLMRLDNWRRTREPVSAGSVLSKYVTNAALVARGILDFADGVEGGAGDTFTPDEALTAGGGLAGSDGVDAPLVTLTSTGQVFIRPADGGAIFPTETIITATVKNVPGATYEWLIDGVIQAGATTSTLTVPSFTPVGAKLVRVNVYGSSGVTVFDVMSVFSLQEGSDAISAGLENENQTIQCDFTGTPISGSFPVLSKMVVARGATFLAAPDVTFSVVSSTGVESAGTTSGASAHVSINAAGDITVTQMVSEYAEIVVRATVGAATIDKVLTLNKSRNGQNGTNGSNAQTLVLTSTAIAFIFADATTTTSSSPTIFLTAALQNVTGSVTFTAEAFNASNGSLGTVSLTGVTATAAQLTPSNFVNGLGTAVRYVRVTATLGSLSDYVTIYRGENGSSALNLVMSNEAHTVPTASDGSGGNFSTANTTVQLYRGITDETSSWSFSISATNCTATINGSSGPVSGASSITLAVSAMSADVAQVQITATRASNPTQQRYWRLSKSRAGTNGGSGTRGSLRGYSTSVSPAVYMSGTTWSSPTDDYNAAKVIWQMLGPGNGGGSSFDWVAGTTSHLRIGDTVTLKNSAGTASQDKFWSGSSWLDPGTVISGNLLVGGTISGAVNLNIAGSAIFDGINSAITVQTNGGSASKSTCVRANYAGSAEVGLYGRSTATGGYGTYGEGVGSSGVGVVGYGNWGVMGIASGSSAGVVGFPSSSSGSVGVSGSASNASTVGIQAVNVFGGTALQVIGQMTINTTTKVANLNADLLDGKDWAAPDPIGSSTPNSGSFTTLVASGLVQVGSLRINQGSSAGSGAWNLPNGGVTSSGKPGSSSTGVFVPVNMNGASGWMLWWPN